MIQDIFLFKLTCEAFPGIHFQNQKRDKLLQCIRTIFCASPSAALGPAAVTDNRKRDQMGINQAIVFLTHRHDCKDHAESSLPQQRTCLNYTLKTGSNLHEKLLFLYQKCLRFHTPLQINQFHVRLIYKQLFFPTTIPTNTM